VSQLTLNLFSADHFAFRDFIKGGNGETLVTLENWLKKNEPLSFYVWGSQGTGKTHLLQAAVRQINQLGLRAIYLPLKDVTGDVQRAIEGLEAMDLVALDDIDSFYGIEAENALFNLYNRTKDKGGKIFFSSREKPGGEKLSLPDLVSRLNAGFVYKLQELDEEQKARFLISVAEHRGLKLERPVVDFIMRTCKRDMNSLCVILNLLDSASLQYGRALTVPFSKEILSSIEQESEF
jgi:DnaA family protein